MVHNGLLICRFVRGVDKHSLGFPAVVHSTINGMPLGHASTCDTGYSMSLLSYMHRVLVASTSTHHVMLTLSLSLSISSIPFIHLHTSHCVYPLSPSVALSPLLTPPLYSCVRVGGGDHPIGEGSPHGPQCQSALMQTPYSQKPLLVARVPRPSFARAQTARFNIPTILFPADNHVLRVPKPCKGHPGQGLGSPYGQSAANKLRPLPLSPAYRAPKYTCTTMCPATSPTTRPCIPGC